MIVNIESATKNMAFKNVNKSGALRLCKKRALAFYR
jgi:hypothetical protein